MTKLISHNLKSSIARLGMKVRGEGKDSEQTTASSFTTGKQF